MDYVPDPGVSNTDALHFGSYVHKILEDGVKAKTREELVEIARQVKGTYKVSKTYDGKDLICIDNFLKFNALLSETISAEMVFEVQIEDDISLNGVIDRVIKGDDGGMLVIDYKTSKREKTKVDLYQDTQLKGYVYAIHKMYNVPIPNIVAAHYYPLTNNFVTVRYSVPQIHAHARAIKDQVWKIRKSKKEEMKPSRNEFCNWCQYQSICPEFNDPMLCESKKQELLKNKKPYKKRK